MDSTGDEDMSLPRLEGSPEHPFPFPLPTCSAWLLMMTRWAPFSAQISLAFNQVFSSVEN